MSRMLGKKGGVSHGGSSGSSGSSESSTYSYNDDFYHPAEDTSAAGTEYNGATTAEDSTSVLNAFNPDESTLSAEMQIIKWSGIAAGVGFVLFAAFFLIAALIKRVSHK